jgi:uncharacterized protein YgiM (DUF1202 family)
MKSISLFILAAMMILFCTSSHAEDVYYVQSLKAKVMKESSFRSNVIGEAGKGQKLVSTGREGSWIKVRYDSQEGYVSSLLVAVHPPLEKASLIKGREGDIKQGVRRRASTYTSAAAARGLASEDRKRLNEEGRADYEALEKMEALTIGAEEVEQFEKGGKR